jgi:hydrogenase maturation protease
VSGWADLRGEVPRTVTVAGVEVGRGTKVVLRPGPGGDVLDRAVAGRTAVVDGIHQELDGAIQLSVLVDDDPGRDLGERRQPGHRFFFAPEEVEPLAGQTTPDRRILVAGIGNIFMADDAFGVEVARRLGDRELPPGVVVGDFGIRGMDLMYALGEGYDAAVFVDAMPRGEPPGTLTLLEPDLGEDEGGQAALNAHGMDPVKVLALAKQVGPVPERVLVVGCEPAVRMTGDEEELVGEISAPVRAAIDPAVAMVESVISDLLDEGGR